MDANTKHERNLSVKVNSPEGEKYTKKYLKYTFSGNILSTFQRR